jgi:ATP-dependent helicase/DNAse subunit B
LAAQGWRPAEASLTAAERGSLLHAVLRSFWADAPEGVRTQADLQNPATRKAVAERVRRVLEQELRPHLRERLPRRYLELEELRLTKLVNEWLDYEAARLEFEVIATELKRTVSVAGLALDLRLDRVDRLRDGSQLVIDYKTGDVSPNSWELPRPDDVQLPLYAGFALDSNEVLGGLVFAKVRPSAMSFAGRVGDAAATLFPGLKGNNALIKTPLTIEQLLDWRDCIEQLARDFLAGRAEVDPGRYPKTCERCELQSLCRIREFPPRLETEEEPDSLCGAEAGDE